MPLITLQNVDFSVGGPLLLEDVVLSIEPGERIALIGRNGAGKSTLMRLMAGEIQADDGEIRREGGVRVARLEQEVPAGADGDVFDVVAGGLGELGAWLAQYHHLSHAEHVDTDALAKVQAKIEDAHGWSLDQRVTETLERLDLDGDADVRAAVRRHEAPRAAGARAGVVARPAAAGRADQPPRHRGDRLARRIPQGLAGRAGVRHPRPPLPARAGHAHRRDRPRPGHQLAGRLGQLPAPPRGAAATPRRRRTRASTRCWRRRKCGSARASRRAAPATKAACAGSRRCAANARSGANRPATSRWRWPQGDSSGTQGRSRPRT